MLGDKTIAGGRVRFSPDLRPRRRADNDVGLLHQRALAEAANKTPRRVTVIKGVAKVVLKQLGGGAALDGLVTIGGRGPSVATKFGGVVGRSIAIEHQNRARRAIHDRSGCVSRRVGTTRQESAERDQRHEQY